MKKIISLKEINKVIPKISDKKTVLVGGCFDLFHFGHLTFLQNSKKAGDFLIVALESDEFIKKYKKRTPIHSQNQRAEILSSIIYVDLVVKLPLLKSDKEYYDLVKLVKPSIIAITDGDSQVGNKRKQATMVGAKLKVVANLLNNFSTNRIIKVLRFDI